VRRRFLIASAISVGVVAAGATLAAAVGLLVPVKGSSVFCLTTEAASALSAQGVSLSASAPAELDMSGPTPCVRVSFSGSVSADLADGGAQLQGGMVFTRAGSVARLELSKLTADVPSRTLRADVAVNGAPAVTTDFLGFSLDPAYVSLSASGARAVDDPAVLSPQGAAAFDRAFGTVPVSSGSSLFRIMAEADFLSGLPGL
jgi:hypothetical protein